MATLFLPEDIISQILVRLPVRSLLRSKSVCKSWYGFIQSSHFIQCQITTTTMVEKNSKLGGTIICQHRGDWPTPDPLYLLSDEGFKDVRPPGAMDMVDCVHGIICMYNNITRDIVLWNPATRKSRLLPKPPNGNPPKNGYKHRDFVGLGFDVATKDYKVIQVSSINPEHQFRLKLGVTSLPKVQIYCLSTDSWRLMDSDFRTGTAHCFSPLAVGRSVNGIYFHLCLDYTAKPFKEIILSFDLSKEKYQRVLQGPVDGCSQLEIIGDKLACISRINATYKVWVLNDYNDNTVKELWTETYRFDDSSRITYGCSSMLALLWNGNIGLFLGKTLILHNSVTDETEDLGFGLGIKLYRLGAEIYKESLVSVDASASPTKTISS